MLKKARGNITITDLREQISATLDNNTALVRVDGNNKVVAAQTVTATVHMWIGTTPLAINSVKVFDSSNNELTNASNTGSVTYTNGTSDAKIVQISFAQNDTLSSNKDYRIVVKNEASNVERSAIFTVYPLKWGEDGNGLEFIYKAFTSEQVWTPNTTNNPARWDAVQSPNYTGPKPITGTIGWQDHPYGVDSTNKYEYVSVRRYTDGAWGTFETPTLWSKYGTNGIDGDGVEYVYVRTKEEVAPVYYGSKKTIDGENADSHDRLWNEDEYTPMVKVTGQDISGYGDPSPITGESGVYKVECTDDPVGVTEQWPYEWVLKRRKSEPDATGKREWSDYAGTMTLWAKRGEDGPATPRYWLEVSPTSVNVDHEYKLTEAVSDITVNLWKQVGDNNPVRLTKAEIEPMGGLFVRGIINSSIDPSTDFSIDDYEEFLSYFVLDDNGTFHSANMTDLDENGNPIYTRKGLSVGTEFRSLSFSWDNYDTKEIHVNVAGAPGPQGPQGPQGPEGQGGKTGKAYYLAGDYENKEYTSDEYQTPVVHIINSEGKDEWHVLVADSNNVGTSIRPVYRSPLGDTTVYLGETIWRKAFTEYDVVMTKAIFADFASLGSALVYGDYLFSKHGTIGTTAYDDDNPNYVLDRPAYLRFCGGSKNYNRTFENRYISVTPNSEYRTVDLVTFEATEGEILGGYINCTKVSGSAIIGIAVRKDDGTILWDGDISFASNGSGDIYEMIYDAEGEEAPEFTSDGVYTLYATVSNNTTASYNISGNITLTGGAFIPNWMVDLRTGNMIAANGKFKVEGDKLIVNDITATGGTFNNITAEGGTFTDIIVNGSIISNRLGKYTINYDANEDMIYVKDGNTYTEHPLYSLKWWADDAPVPNYVIIDYNGYGAINLEHHTEDCYVELPCPRNSVGKKITIFVRRVNEWNAGTTIGANIILVSGYDHATETWSSFADYCRDFESGQCVKFDSKGSGVEAYAKVELISDGYNWIVVTSDRDITTFFDETMKYFI